MEIFTSTETILIGKLENNLPNTFVIASQSAFEKIDGKRKSMIF